VPVRMSFLHRGFLLRRGLFQETIDVPDAPEAIHDRGDPKSEPQNR
jgi:hypothetical protein